MLNSWAFWSTAHLLWLEFQSWPMVVYAEGPGLIGGILPLLVSLLILLHFSKIWKSYSSHTIQFFAGVLLSSVAIGLGSGYWSAIGYHFLDLGMVFWPLLALISPNFPALLAYPLTFLPGLLVDFIGAGEHGHWAGFFWYGIGGAGLHDGLFLFPLTALVAAVLCSGLGQWLRNSGVMQGECI